MAQNSLWSHSWDDYWDSDSYSENMGKKPGICPLTLSSSWPGALAPWCLLTQYICQIRLAWLSQACPALLLKGALQEGVIGFRDFILSSKWDGSILTWAFLLVKLLTVCGLYHEYSQLLANIHLIVSTYRALWVLGTSLKMIFHTSFNLSTKFMMASFFNTE